MSFLMAYLDFREPVSAWTHGGGLVLSIPATALLWRRAAGDPARRLTLVVFGLSLAFCYAGSTLFHAVRLDPDWIHWFDQLDHIGIFILIAGSYTPVAWNLLQGRLKWGTLVSAWFAAAAGTGLLLVCGIFTIFWSTVFYLAMGWGAVFCYLEIARAHSHRTVFPMLVGGVLYSLGAVMNLAHWPVLWPGVFGPHELFHLFVMAGSTAHFIFMHAVVARPAAAATTAVAVAPREPAAVPAATVLLTRLATRQLVRGLERLPDPRIPRCFRTPLYLIPAPVWNRQREA
jgi:hemolysin III